MIKFLTIIGARPQIIKASAISRAIKNNFSDSITEIIVHTGQHYDENMSGVFFDELQIPQPNYNLNVGSSSHGAQTAEMIKGIEDILLKEKPDYVILYGDTNSTLAGSIAASKLHFNIAHIEAGLRSFNKKMPEEINRIMCDHASTMLFSPTKTGYDNLINEGFKTNNKPPYTSDNQGIYHCGDVMYDNSLYFANIAKTKSNILEKNKLEENKFILSTIHRDNNTDDEKRLNSIIKMLLYIAEDKNYELVLPLHPRTKKVFENKLSKDLYNKLNSNKNIKIIEPVSFLDMIRLEDASKMVITDSGGVQKEAFFFKKPCIILRPETEWVELVKCGVATLANDNYEKFVEAFNYYEGNKNLQYSSIFGDGNASTFICNQIINNYNLTK